MVWRQQRLNAAGVFVLLLCASAICLLLPARWTDPLKHVAQFLVPPQDLFYSAATRVTRAVNRIDQNANQSGTAMEQLQAELGAEQALIEQLRVENADLRKLRATHELPSLPILPAKIVAMDMVEWRDSMLVARGSSRGVHSKDWATSRLFLDQGRASDVENGQAVLSRECLLGRVEQVSPYMARVQLLSDVDSPRLEVRVAAVDGATLRFLELPCILKGKGRGKMEIENVGYQYVQTSAEETTGGQRTKMRVGDLVYSAPGQMGLPVPLVVGRVTEIKENPQKRLVWTLSVEPLVTADRLREVFVIPLMPVEPAPL